jgi:hypothetical protein
VKYLVTLFNEIPRTGAMGRRRQSGEILPKRISPLQAHAMDFRVFDVPKIRLAAALCESRQLYLDIFGWQARKLRNWPVPLKTSRSTGVTRHAICIRFLAGAEITRSHADPVMPRLRWRRHRKRHRCGS